MDNSGDLGLQPVGHHSEKPLVDVVFVHGLGGNAKGTWGIQPFWPELLAKNHTEARVWSYGHNAPLFNLSDESGAKKELQDTSTQLLAALNDKGLGTKVPLVFVAHSLGGLIVKAALRQDQHSKIGRPDHRYGTRAVVFIATPHSGSSLANFSAVFPKVVRATVSLVTTLLGWLPILGPPIEAFLQRSKLVAQLERDAAPLRELAIWYRAWAQQYDVMTKAYFETRHYRRVMVVEPSSADPGVSGCAPVPVDKADHVTIAKVTETSDPVYRGVDYVVSKTVSMAKAGTATSVFEEAEFFQEALNSTRGSNPKFEAIHIPLDKQLEKIPRENNVRIEFITGLIDRLRTKCRTGMLKLSAVEEGAARDSQYAIDRLVLYVWLEHKLWLVFSEICERIRSEVSAFKPESNESLSLIPLNRSVRSLDGAILEDLPKLREDLLEARRKILARREREAGIQEDYKTDGNGSTRRLLSKILHEFRAISSARDEFRNRKGSEPFYDGAS